MSGEEDEMIFHVRRQSTQIALPNLFGNIREIWPTVRRWRKKMFTIAIKDGTVKCALEW
jgi:hypothetical protein